MLDCSLLVMSCDKYETAWYPFFSLLHKFWRDHPKEIVLSTESKEFELDGLQIRCTHGADNGSWSDRLLLALQSIKTKYVVLSLEDFFLQGPVQQDVVERCYTYMEEHPEVAQCRFKNCDNAEQLSRLGEEVFTDFYLAGSDVIFRLDTQMALWNRDTLISYVISGEDPWQFETNGTQRIKNTEKKFLWYKSPASADDTLALVFPYQMSLASGYGISLGHWLWNNKKLFAQNGIHADLDQLGILSHFQVRYRLFKNKALYQDQVGFFHRLFRMVYRAAHKIGRSLKRT